MLALFTHKTGALYGGGSDLFYSQFDLHTRDQKVGQIVLREVYFMIVFFYFRNKISLYILQPFTKNGNLRLHLITFNYFEWN